MSKPEPTSTRTEMAKRTTLPDGFQQVSVGELPPKPNWTEGMELIGVVVVTKTATITRGRKREENRYMIIDVDGTEYTIWESAALTDLFNEAAVNDSVWLRYLGPVNVPNQPLPMFGYETAIKRAPREKTD